MARRGLIVAALDAGEEPDWASAEDAVAQLSLARVDAELAALVLGVAETPALPPATLDDEAWNEYLLDRVRRQLRRDLDSFFTAAMLNDEPGFYSLIVRDVHVCLAASDVAPAELYDVMARLEIAGILAAAGFDGPGAC